MIKAISSLAAVVVAIGLSVSTVQAHSHEVAFHAHVTANNIAPVMLDAQLAVGDVVPEATEIHPVPDVIIARAPELAAHRFVVANDRIHVIHPETRAVVAVIDRR